LLSRIGSSSSGIVAFALAVAFAGACVVGGQIGIVAVASTIYSSAIRSSGIGWALGVGRSGSVIGPLIGSALLAANFDDTKVFLIGAIPVLIGAVLSFSADRFNLHSSQTSGTPAGGIDHPAESLP
jgi:AAHS family 4-hydroxybenzoate transporter-like MFS transporter